MAFLDQMKHLIQITEDCSTTNIFIEINLMEEKRSKITKRLKRRRRIQCKEIWLCCNELLLRIISWHNLIPKSDNWKNLSKSLPCYFDLFLPKEYSKTHCLDVNITENEINRKKREKARASLSSFTLKGISISIHVLNDMLTTVTKYGFINMKTKTMIRLCQKKERTKKGKRITEAADGWIYQIDIHWWQTWYHQFECIIFFTQTKCRAKLSKDKTLKKLLIYSIIKTYACVLKIWLVSISVKGWKVDFI